MMITVTAAATEPVTLAEAKAHLRITHTADDTMLGAMITAAREAVEMNTGRALAAAEYRWASEDEIDYTMRLPLWPVDAVSEVSYAGADGARVTMDAADYTVDVDRATLALTPPSGGSNLSVTFTVAPTNIPAPLKAAILLLIGDLYENAEATIVGVSVAANPAADRLLYPYRVNLGL